MHPGIQMRVANCQSSLWNSIFQIGAYPARIRRGTAFRYQHFSRAESVLGYCHSSLAGLLSAPIASRGTHAGTCTGLSYNTFVNELSGKRVLITGGARHLGKAIALGMARAGGRVAFTYLNSRDEAQQTLAEIQKLDSKALAIPCDIRKKESIAEAVKKVVDDLGGLDIL